MDGVFFKNVEDFFDESDENARLVNNLDGIPPFIYRQMVEAGMFAKEREDVDNYINPDALEVVLDDETWTSNPRKFIVTLKKAMKKNLDSIVFDVIQQFKEEKHIIETIFSSGIHKYIAKMIDQPLDLCESMIKGKDNKKGAVLKFIKSKKANCWAAQYVIVKTGHENWISALFSSQTKFYLSFDDVKDVLCNKNLLLALVGRTDLDVSFLIKLVNMGDDAVIFKLLKQPYLYASVKDEISKLDNGRFLPNLLDCDSLSFLTQEKVAKTGDRKMIAKLLSKISLGSINFNALKIITGRKYNPSCGASIYDFYLCSIVHMGIEEYSNAIIDKINTSRCVVQWLFDTRNEDLINKLDEQIVLRYKRLKKFVGQEHLLRLFNKRELSYLEQLKVLESKHEELIFMLIKRDELNPVIEASIVTTRNDRFISKLFERSEINYLAQVKIVESRNEKHILKLIKRGDLNPLIQASIVETKNELFISKLFERSEFNYLAQVKILESGNEEHILKLIEHPDLNGLIYQKIKETGNPLYLKKLSKRKIVDSHRTVIIDKNGRTIVIRIDGRVEW